jgi:hypothetical protein
MVILPARQPRSLLGKRLPPMLYFFSNCTRSPTVEGISGAIAPGAFKKMNACYQVITRIAKPA